MWSRFAGLSPEMGMKIEIRLAANAAPQNSAIAYHLSDLLAGVESRKIAIYNNTSFCSTWTLSSLCY